MRQGQSERTQPPMRKAPPCRPCFSEPIDPELEALFHELSLTLFALMDPADADILARAELGQQTAAQIASRIGCSTTEATRRLAHARRCFCRLAAKSLACGP